MTRNDTAAPLVPAALLCVLALAWTDRATSLWVAAPVAVIVAPFLAVTARFGRDEHHLGLLALAGLGVASLLGMAVAETVPPRSLLAPLALGLGAGIAASHLYVMVVGPAIGRTG